jgi:orotidine-5'-phosphate decarboxylase
MIKQNQIYIALDRQNEVDAFKLLNQFKGLNIGIKIGMEIYYSLGADFIYKIKDQGFNIFLDLKLHDIPNTVYSALKVLSKHPIDILNVHAAGGLEMMQKASQAIHESNSKLLLIAVTQLTSTSEEQMKKEQLIQESLEKSVLNYATLAKKAGLHGVVCSPKEITLIKNVIGLEFKTVTPGIRPQGSELNDQKRTMTPIEAFKAGGDYLVIGRPVTASKNPREALLDIIEGKS